MGTAFWLLALVEVVDEREDEVSCREEELQPIEDIHTPHPLSFERKPAT